MVSLYTCIILYSEFTNPQKEGPEVIPIKGPSTLLHLNTIIIHQTHYEKTDWARAFNQFTIACELDMIIAISANYVEVSCTLYCLIYVKKQ